MMMKFSIRKMMCTALLLTAMCVYQSRAKKMPLVHTNSGSPLFLSKNKKNSTHLHYHHHNIGAIVGGFTTVYHNHHFTQRQNQGRAHTLKGLLRSDRDDGAARPTTAGVEHNSYPYSLHKHQYVRNTMAMSEEKNVLDHNNNESTVGGGTIPDPRMFIQRNRLRKNRYAKLTPLSSTIHAGYVPTITRARGEGMALRQYMSSLQKRMLSSVAKIDVQDYAVYLSYVCTTIAITLPVILIPMIAADPYKPLNTSLSSPSIGKLSGPDLASKIVSTSSLGAALGKVINGFVCQAFGARASASVYFLGLAICSFLLSTTSSLHTCAVAGMEFCTSIMWVACNVLIANKYSGDPKKFASAITVLSLCSTIGSLSSKLIGSVLLSKYHWREVALISTVASSLGAFLMFFVVKDVEAVEKGNSWRKILWPVGGASHKDRDSNFSLRRIASSIAKVLSNKMFWLVALAHSCSFLGRSSDKILGTFLVDITNIPRHVCASLTTAVTVGFIGGLVSGRKMESMDESKKRPFIIKRQCGAIFSALSIAILANETVILILGKKVVATAITMASCLMTASLSIQFYQFPSKFAQTFGDDKAVCVAFTDALAYFLTSPIWAIVNSIALSARFGSNGWSVAWILVSVMFAIGGGLSLKTMKETL